MRFFSPLLILVALLTAACGGAVLPDEFTRERADGKIPVSIPLIREQTEKEIDGMPEGQAKVERWQVIEKDHNACRLSSSRKTKAAADKIFADCMSRKGYVYMYRLDAEQLHGDIAGKMFAQKSAMERAAKEANRAAEKRRKEEQSAAKKKAEQDEKDSNLRSWVRKGNIAKIRDLLAAGANPNAANDNGVTALMLAALRGYLEIAKVLIDAGANPNAANDNGVPALIYAVEQGHPEIVKMLLAVGANPNAKKSSSWTTLMGAVWHGHLEITKILLDAGANPNATRDNGTTALGVAAWHGHLEVAKMLLAAGARPNWKGKEGATALIIATITDRPEIVKVLLACGASPDIRDDDGWSTWNHSLDHPLIRPILKEYKAAIDAGSKPKSCVAKRQPQQPKKPAAKAKKTV